MLNLFGYRASKPEPTPTPIPSPSHGREPPNYVRFTIFSGVLVSLTLLPYITIRKHISPIHRTLGELNSTNGGLRRDLKVVLLESNTRKGEYAKVLELLEKTRRELNEVKVAAEKQNAQRVLSEQRMKGDIRALLEERKKFREQMGAMQGMSEVLATIAAFMQEIEIQLGLPIGRKEDSRGYEKIRRYAQGFHDVLMGSGGKTSEPHDQVQEVKQSGDSTPLPDEDTGNTKDTR